jgi:integrase
LGAVSSKNSLGTKDKGEAKRLQRQQRLQAMTGNGNGSLQISDPTAAERPSFWKAVELHEANTAFGRKSTARNLRLRKRTMLRFCSSRDEFQPVSIWKKFDAEGEALKKEKALEGGWVSAPNQLRWYLRSFSNFCLERGWVLPNQVSGKIPSKIVPPRRVQIPTPKAVSDFLLMCEAEDAELGSFIRWLTNSGLRLSATASVRWEDIDFSAGEYRRKMKGGKVVVIPLLPDALALLRARWVAAGCSSSALVFSLGDARIKRSAESCGNMLSVWE